MDIQTLECDKIEFPGADEAARSFRKEVAEGLALSIEAEGMYHPIAVRADPDKPGYFQGVQGRHRLHAQHRILGRPMIACNVLVMDDDEAEMAAIAENTFRKELSQAERSKALRLWHRMFAAKHPERVGRGKAGRAAMQARKAAKARGEDRASDQKTKLNRATASGKTAAESEDQKSNLNLPSDSRETEGEAGTATEHQKANLNFKSAGSEAESEAGTVTEDQKTNLNLQADGHGADGEGEGHPANFAKTVAAATGCSETTAKREVRVAINLTDEQLRVCDQLNKGQIDSIAGIKDETKRAEVIELIAFGLGFDDAWEEADPDARKATGKSRSQEAAAAAAEQEMRPELSDDEWFDQFCAEKAALLGNPAGFKADALIFRGVTRPRHFFRAEVEGTLNDAKAAKVAGPFYDLLDRFVSAGHPNDWPLCDACRGSGGGRNGAGCTTCRGAGYLLKNPSEDLTTVAEGNREDRTASPGKGSAPSPLNAASPPGKGRACNGKPRRPVTPDPRAAAIDAEQAAIDAEQAAMFDEPLE